MILRQTITPFNFRKYPPIPSGSSFIYKVQFFDENNEIITPGAFQSLLLSIVDVETGSTVMEGENVLNSDRASFDVDYSLSIEIQPEETTIQQARLTRAIVLSWTYGPSEMVGRHQANFDIVKLSGD